MKANCSEDYAYYNYITNLDNGTKTFYIFRYIEFTDVKNIT